MRIRAVFFDMGGTIETFGYTRELRMKAVPGLRAILEQAAIALPLDDEGLLDLVSAGLDCYKRWSIETLQELPPATVWRNYILSDYSIASAQLELFAEDLALYVETKFYDRHMRPEMREVLRAICNLGLKMGVISNVNSRGQVPLNLTEYGIGHYFDPVVLSSEYGRRKPDPAIFHYAARLARVPTSECAYVGDRIVRDIDGARRAGFGLAIQIRHDFEHGENDEGATPDAIIGNMSELVDILRSRLAADHDPIPSCNVRAVLFDAGDILYHRPNRGRHFQGFLEELALEISSSQKKEREALSHEAYRGRLDPNAYQEAVLRAYGISDPLLVQRGKEALANDENDVEIFDGVRDTLIALKARGLLLGIVTDTANPISAKLGWFERGGFGHVWDSIISSQDLGIRKPDRRMYEAALEQLGVTPQQTAFVGHRAVELQGARDVGIRTIALNYDPDAEADVFIEDFADLLNTPILKSREEPSAMDL